MSEIGAGTEEARTSPQGSSWPLTSFTALQKCGRYRINSGQTAPSGLTGSAAFDPERTPDGRSGCSLDDTRRMQPEGGATTNFDGNYSSLLDCKYVPLAGNALEGLAASVAETQPRARHQVLHGARHQYLAGARKRRDTRTDVNGNAADIVVEHFASNFACHGRNLAASCSHSGSDQAVGGGNLLDRLIFRGNVLKSRKFTLRKLCAAQAALVGVFTRVRTPALRRCIVRLLKNFAAGSGLNRT